MKTPKRTGALHGIDYEFHRTRRSYVIVPSLEEKCCKVFASNASLVQRLDPTYHAHLYPRILTATLFNGCSKDVVEALVTTWPRDKLSLCDVRLHPYEDRCIAFARSFFSNPFKHVGFTSVYQRYDFQKPLVTIFIEILKSKMSHLRLLDLRGFPLSGGMLENFIREFFCMRPTPRPQNNTASQSSVDRTQRSDETQKHVFEFYLDCIVDDKRTFKLLSYSLEPRSTSTFTIRLHISKFESDALDFCLVLDILNPEDLMGLHLRYVAGRHDGQLRLLQRFHRLRSLSLKVEFSFDALELCAELGDVLRSLPKLRRLDLSDNHLKDRVHVVLGPVTNVELEYLDLSNCGLSSSDLTYLTKARFTTSLRELKINKNPVLSKEFAVTTLLFQSVAPSLHLLEIADCEFADLQLEPLVKCCLRMRQLHYLDISNNEFLSASISAFIPKLAALPYLECVQLSFARDCGDENCQWLAFREKAKYSSDVYSRAKTYRQEPYDLELDFSWINR